MRAPRPAAESPTSTSPPPSCRPANAQELAAIAAEASVAGLCIGEGCDSSKNSTLSPLETGMPFIILERPIKDYDYCSRKDLTCWCRR
ncbi:hypothetical protein Y1Q_0020230 [Alligator mississippiensis]|uniref:Uncharacterized protein n=1 Tax=Alligator mississippiensis TaxID=8496 RepID=A0A151PIS2_ALLMI|nr:hypothetical protein Y1Q_0020230 [Alligator mississippiensis]